MKTIIKVINIPTDIYEHISKSYEFDYDVQVNKDDVICVTDYLTRLVFLDVSKLNSNFSCAYAKEKLGNKIPIYFKVIDVNHHFYVRDYRSDSPDINYYIKYIKVQLEQKSIDKIKDIINIDKNVSSKNIDFGDND